NLPIVARPECDQPCGSKSEAGASGDHDPASMREQPLNPSPRWHSSSKARASTATVQVPDCRQLSAKQRQRRWRLWQFRCYFPLFITVRLLPGLYCRTNGCQGSRPTGEIAIGGSREVRIGVAKRASSQIAPRVPEGTQL